MNGKLRHILEKFQGDRHTVAHLIEEDGEFHALCEDYEVCVEALRYWEQSKELEAKNRVNEYRTLTRELEEEIRAALESKRLD